MRSVSRRMFLRIWVLPIASAVFVGCVGNPPGNAAPEGDMPPEPIEDVLARETPAWMKIPGVVGTAVGLFEGKPCISVYVSKKTDKLAKQFPDEVGGYRVVLQETGEIEAL